jgi:hypothetical protein
MVTLQPMGPDSSPGVMRRARSAGKQERKEAITCRGAVLSHWLKTAPLLRIKIKPKTSGRLGRLESIPLTNNPHNIQLRREIGTANNTSPRIRPQLLNILHMLPKNVVPGAQH